MKTILYSLFFLFGLAVSGASADTPKTKVFLFAGQSNMDGRGDGSKLTDAELKQLEAAGKRIQFAYNHEPIRPLGLTIPRAGTRKKFNLEKTFGPEVFIGLKLAEQYPEEEMLFIKRAIGGTSLYGCWNPNWTEAKAAQMNEAKSPKLYRDFVDYVKETLTTLPADSYEICGMFWVQGEADSSVTKKGPEPSAEYGANLEALITSVRRELSADQMPLFIQQVGSGGVVEGMKWLAAKDANVNLVEQSSDEASPFHLPGYGPPVGHYNYEGMKRIGLNLAASFQEHSSEGGD